MCMGKFQVPVRILNEDLACYIRDIHKTGNDTDLGKSSMPWKAFHGVTLLRHSPVWLISILEPFVTLSSSLIKLASKSGKEVVGYCFLFSSTIITTNKMNLKSWLFSIFLWEVSNISARFQWKKSTNPRYEHFKTSDSKFVRISHARTAPGHHLRHRPSPAPQHTFNCVTASALAAKLTATQHEACSRDSPRSPGLSSVDLMPWILTRFPLSADKTSRCLKKLQPS